MANPKAAKSSYKPGPANKAQKHNQRRFQLRKVFGIGLTQIVTAKMPLAHFIEQTWVFNDKPLGNEIADCLGAIFSYVTRRRYKENIPSFCPHIAGTVAYENHTGKLIVGKNHSIKAAGILNRIYKIIDKIDIAQAKEKDNCHKIILNDYLLHFKAHANAITIALKASPKDYKTHIKKHTQLDIKKLEVFKLSKEEQKLIQTQYPMTPKRNRKKKDQYTPKHVTTPMREAIGALLEKEMPKNLLNEFKETDPEPVIFSQRKNTLRKKLEEAQDAIKQDNKNKNKPG